MKSWQSFRSLEQLLTAKSTDLPVFCLHPGAIRAMARRFVTGFPGQVLYAVKANPEREVLKWLIEGGLRAFDTASLPEIALVRELLPDALCCYNHPVKPRRAIRSAYAEWGVRDFVVDDPGELAKLLSQTGPEVTIQVRVATQNRDATVSLDSKFGASPEVAVSLLQEVDRQGATPALAMHVGYQASTPAAYARGLAVLAQVAESAGVRPHYVNVGGGFPSVLMPEGLSLGDYFEAIRTAHTSTAALAHAPLRCEPGSALVHPGGSVLAQVLLVKRDGVFLNDGLYGALAEIIHSRCQPPTRSYAPDGSERRGALREFTVFGPTCDSWDTLPVRFRLPADLSEGDWLHFGMMGAYSAPLITDFNGVGAHEYAIIEDRH